MVVGEVDGVSLRGMSVPSSVEITHFVDECHSSPADGPLGTWFADGAG